QHPAGPPGHGGGHRFDGGHSNDFPTQQQGREYEKEKGRRTPAGREENTMRKTQKRWTLFLTCGLLCALLLSGCSDIMQALADGTDAVLNGLAEGTDQIAGALADGTDAALGA